MYFAECRVVDTRQSRLCRVSRGGTRQRSEKQSLPSAPGWHSAKKAPLPSAADLALGKPYFKNKKKSLPSAASRALGKEHKLSQSDGFSFFSLSLTLTRCTPPTPALARRRPRARAHPRRRPRAARRSPRAAHAAARRPRRPLAARPRAAHDHRRPRADDLHAVDRSRPPRRHAHSPSCTVHAEQTCIN
jgi:hypothetical protein